MRSIRVEYDNQKHEHARECARRRRQGGHSHAVGVSLRLEERAWEHRERKAERRDAQKAADYEEVKRQQRLHAEGHRPTPPKVVTP